MKKFLLPILSVVLVIGMASIVWATVIGTPHDIAPEPCAMCHTPHHSTGDYPLWNRYQEDVAAYTPYDSISFDMGGSINNPPRSPSNLCLTCHNGLFSELVNYPGPCSVSDPAYDLQVLGCAEIGEDLMNDHPVSFDYDPSLDTATDNNGFPDVVTVNLGTRVRYAIPGLGGTNYFLYAESAATAGIDRWFECATCHSVHDLATYPGKGDTQVYFLRADNTDSQMCRDCHVNR